MEYFDKIYVILSTKSTSPRGLLQMCARVRKIKDPKINVYLNNIPYKEKANFYTYAEVKEYIKEMFSKYIKPKTVTNHMTGKRVIVYHFNSYVKNLIHNETENCNKTKNLFVAYFIKMLKEKGHTYEHCEIRCNKNGLNKDNILKDEVYDADDVDYEQFNVLLNKQRKNEATKDDKLAIEKYLFKKDWKINELSEEFMNKYYGKTGVLYNLRWYTDTSLLKPYIENKDNELRIDFDPIVKLEQINMIKNMIKLLGFEGIGDGQKLNKKEFEENIEDVMTMSKIFTDIGKSHQLFGFDKCKVGKIKTVKQFMGFCKTVLSELGMVVSYKRTYKHEKVNGKLKTISNDFYGLNYLNKMDKYI